jgi:hypothetical protein
MSAVLYDVYLVKRGTRAAQPAAASSKRGALYCVTDEGYKIERNSGSAWEQFSPTGSVIDHGALLGLSDDDHAQYVLLAGRSGGQTLKGGTAASETLTLQSTAHATKGRIKVPNVMAIDETQGSVVVGDDTFESIHPSIVTAVQVYNPTGFAADAQFQLASEAATPAEYFGEIGFGTRATSNSDKRGAIIAALMMNTTTTARPQGQIQCITWDGTNEYARLLVGKEGVQVGSAAGGDPGHGNLALQGTLTIDGGQIKFPSAQAASSNVNTLDDYEEGTWTPVIGGSGGQSGQAYTTQAGRYLKVGRMVTVQCYVQLSTKGTITTNVQLQGLPFAAVNDANCFPSASLVWFNSNTTFVSLHAVINPFTTTADLRGATAAAATNNTALATADVTNTFGFVVTLTYEADS